jgi:DNA-binding NarL/FixJ family response regulator
MFTLLIVDGLPSSYSDERFHELCAPLTGVQAAWLVHDPAGYPLGFGYLDVESSQADQAIQALQGRQVGSQSLVVRIVETSSVAEIARCKEGKGPGSNDNGRERFHLTKREQEVSEHLAKGLTNKEIASSLGITEPIVKAHIRNIIEKIGH